ncbi:MAG: leucyl aminopeptidase, partial [Campylobacteraceae bacterium]|nr:leucyl aminopeptidase [Campylobacteraceae bacterium]
MKINLVSESFDSLQSDLEVIFVLNKDLNHKSIKDKKLLESLNFKAEDEEVVLLPESKKIYVGCEEDSYDCIAVAISCAVKKLQSTKFKSAKVKLLDGESSTLKALVEGAALGAYSFTKYKSKKNKNKQELFIVTKNSSKELTKTFNDSLIIAESVNKTRDFVNTTPEDFYPKTMTKEAKKISKLDDITMKVYGEEYLEKNKMFSMLGVGRASRHESQLIHLTYKPKNAKTKVVLVGKGLTYDSGGLSLKPAGSMVTMKSDKSGACTVLGALNAIAKLKLPIEVHCILGAVENMIGGDAFKPDDVLTAKNGTTIEIRN